MGLLDGRVVLITGAGRGIGREHALLMASEGAKVVVNDLGGGVDGSGEDTGPAEQTAQEIRDMGGEAVANNDSVTDWEGSQRMINAAVEAFGDLHVLVNNAGIALSVHLEDDNEADLDRLWSVNVKAPLSMTRKCMPHLRGSGRGRVINIASVAGKVVFGSGVGYSMSKFALVAISHATRQAAWDDGVRCTAVCPGYVATDMTSEVESTTQDLMIKPSDIAALVATAMELSNNASVAELIVNCRPDPTM